MNVTDFSKFRDILMAMLDDAQRESAAANDAQSIVKLDQQSVGRLSRMDAIQQQAMALAVQQRRTNAKARIVAALARLDNDEFGYCINCGDEIGLNRLTVDPTIHSCMMCTGA